VRESEVETSVGPSALAACFARKCWFLIPELILRIGRSLSVTSLAFTHVIANDGPLQHSPEPDTLLYKGFYDQSRPLRTLELLGDLPSDSLCDNAVCVRVSIAV
jgi:hypothetical protein